MKPPRKPDAMTAKGIQQHLEQVNKVLSNISVGNTSQLGLVAPAPGNSTRIIDQDRNIAGDKFVATSPAAPNTEFSISHNLGRIPHGFIYLGGSNQGQVYKGVTSWTATQVFLKETQGSNTFFILLV